MSRLYLWWLRLKAWILRDAWIGRYIIVDNEKYLVSRRRRHTITIR